jgi:UDP-glucose 4-epimerase
MRRLRPAAGDLVLVTGATGRIGANLCRALQEHGYRVRAVVLPNDPGTAKLADVDLRVADLRDAEATAEACQGVDAIYHLAALMGPDAGEMPVTDYWHVNVDATLHVLEGARHNGRVAKFIFASTDATYPAVKPLYSPIDEHHPQNPVNLYGLTKVVGERLCLDYLTEFDVPVAILRYGAVASPDERARGGAYLRSAVLQRFRDAKRSHNNYLWVTVRDCERPWDYLGPCDGSRDQLVALTDADGRPWLSHPTDVRDVVRGTLLALESPAAVGEAFNIVGPAPVASTEAVRFLAERLGLPWQQVRVPFRQAYEISTVKARSILGYTPEIDFFRAVVDGQAMLRGQDIGVIPGRVPVARH